MDIDESLESDEETLEFSIELVDSSSASESFDSNSLVEDGPDCPAAESDGAAAGATGSEPNGLNDESDSQGAQMNALPHDAGERVDSAQIVAPSEQVVGANPSEFIVSENEQEHEKVMTDDVQNGANLNDQTTDIVCVEVEVEQKFEIETIAEKAERMEEEEDTNLEPKELELKAEEGVESNDGDHHLDIGQQSPKCENGDGVMIDQVQDDAPAEVYPELRSANIEHQPEEQSISTENKPIDSSDDPGTGDNHDPGQLEGEAQVSGLESDLERAGEEENHDQPGQQHDELNPISTETSSTGQSDLVPDVKAQIDSVQIHELASELDQTNSPEGEEIVSDGQILKDLESGSSTEQTKSNDNDTNATNNSISAEKSPDQAGERVTMEAASDDHIGGQEQKAVASSDDPARDLGDEIGPIVEQQQEALQTELNIPEGGERDESTPIPLGSPDIQISAEQDDGQGGGGGGEGEGAGREINGISGLHHDSCDTESDHSGEDEDENCPTPTAQLGETMLDSNCLGFNSLNLRDFIYADLDSEEDLEAEFDNEPPFEARDVLVRRGQDPKVEYEFGEELGRGKFGTVFRVRNKSTSVELAAKTILIRRQEDLQDVEQEVAIMSILQHPRLVQLYDAYLDCPSSPASGFHQICLITELIEGGELFERIVDDDFDLTEKKAAIFMRQICEGVEYMHEMGVVHLDMKPENILCISKTSNRIKLIDFGLARQMKPGEQLRVMFGTPDFAAPEVLSYDVVSFATDMWSVGVICYVLLSGLSPFMGDSDVETMANVQRATYDFDSEAFDPITDLAKDFISRLLVKDPRQRMKPAECLEHAWLQRGGHLLQVAVRSRRESMVSIMSSRSDNFDLTQFNGPSGIASLTSLSKRNLKRYVIRRKWHRTVNAIMALGRMGANLKQMLTGQSGNTTGDINDN